MSLPFLLNASSQRKKLRCKARIILYKANGYILALGNEANLEMPTFVNNLPFSGARWSTVDNFHAKIFLVRSVRNNADFVVRIIV